MPVSHPDDGPRLEQSFNDAWSFRPYQSVFLELAGSGVGWTPVTLPHDAMITQLRDGSLPERAGVGFFPDGAWEYKKSFFVPEQWRDRRAVLEFEGVYRGARVYINGNLAAERPYGYSGFFVQLDPFLRYGHSNEITVRAHTHEDSRWYSGAGIYRNTRLTVTSLLHVVPDGVRITVPRLSDDEALVTTETTVQNASISTATVELLTEILDKNGSVARDAAPLTLTAGESATLRQSMLISRPNRWDIDTPFLYTCRTTLAEGSATVDQVQNTFGVRSVSVDVASGFRLNERTVKLRGACIHHDNGVLGAATISRAEERRVELLKAAGFNALRSAHNPMSKSMLDACDKLGMLVMDEAFDAWTVPKNVGDYSADFARWWQADIDAMVLKDINRPCVVMYSIGNEIPEVGSPLGARWSRMLADRVRSLDGSRPVTCGVNALLAVGADLFAGITPAEADKLVEDAGVNTMLTMMKEILPRLMQADVVAERLAETFAHLDVAGYNYLESRYELDGTLFPNRVIVGSETQAGDIARNWSLVKTHSHLIGDFTWTGWDYLGEVGVGRIGYADEEDASGPVAGFMATYPWLTAWCGDIDITGHRRPASFFREIVFGLRTDPYIAVLRPERYGAHVTHTGPWGWSDSVSSWTWPGFEGQPVRLEVYADADEVELNVNGRTVATAKVGEHAAYQAQFETVYEAGEIVAVATRGGAEVGRTSLRTATGKAQLAATADRSQIRADDSDLAYVTGQLVDVAGTAYTGVDRLIGVSVEGPGILQGFGSGSPRTEENFFDSERTSFDGRVLAVIRPTAPGDITITFTAADCLPAVVHVRAEPVPSPSHATALRESGR